MDMIIGVKEQSLDVTERKATKLQIERKAKGVLSLTVLFVNTIPVL